MASIQELIGRRPGGYSFGEGLGTALVGAGGYYGELAIQKKNAEALAEARGYDEKVRKEDRDYETTVRADQRALALGDRDEERVYAKGQLGEAWTREDDQQAALNERTDIRNTTLDNQIARVVDRPNPETGKVEQWGVDSDGNDVKMLGENADYVVNTDGQAVRQSAGGAGDTEKAANVRQGDLKMHAENMDASLAGMGKVLGEGYELDGGKAFFDQLAGAIGVGGNWLKSPQGRQYSAYQTLGVESFQKAISGAAGSESEGQKYQVLFPAPGDDIGTTRVKASVLHDVIYRLKEASAQYSGVQLANYMRTQLTLESAKSGLDLTTGTAFDTPDAGDAIDWSSDELLLIQEFGN